jgi:hypothetical protein
MHPTHAAGDPARRSKELSMSTHRRHCRGAILASAFGALLVGAPACSSTPASDSELVATQAQALWQEAGYSLWPTKNAEGVTMIPVCWASGLDSGGGGTALPAMQTPNFPQMSQWVQDALAAGWQGAANLVFTGWGECASNNSADYVNGKLGPTIMVLFDNANSSGAWASAGYQSGGWTTVDLDPMDTEAIFKGSVLHEFGHALGFAHEVDRPDNPTIAGGANPCARDTGSLGVYLTPVFDPQSIMSFSYPCNGDSTNGVQNAAGDWVLSRLDIAGVQYAYGRKPDGSMVNVGSARCLDVPSASTQNGLETWLWECWGGPNQRWFPLSYAPDGPPGLGFSWAGNGSPKCLDALGYGTANGTSADSWACVSGDTAQAFSYPSFQLVGMGGTCLDARTGTPQMYGCGTFGDSTSSPYQQWSYSPQTNRISISLPEGRFRGFQIDETFCLTAAGTTDGSPVTLASCGASGQTWAPYTASGSIVNLGTGKCLDVNVANGSWGTADGNPVQVYDCARTNAGVYSVYKGINQAWTMRGNFVGLGGNCLDVAGAGTGNANPVDMWQCLAPGQPQQVWDYYMGPLL